jgi:hypothetical protein
MRVPVPRDTGEVEPGARYQPVAVPGPFAQIQMLAVWPACSNVGASTIKKLLDAPPPPLVPLTYENVDVPVMGATPMEGDQDAVTVKVPVAQLTVPPVVNVSVKAPAAETVTPSVKTVVPTPFVIWICAEVPEPGPGEIVPVIVPVCVPE